MICTFNKNEKSIQFQDENGLVIREYKGFLMTNFQDGYASAVIFYDKTRADSESVLLDQYGKIIHFKHIYPQYADNIILDLGGRIKLSYYDFNKKEYSLAKIIRIGLKKYYGLFEFESFMVCTDNGKSLYLLNHSFPVIIASSVIFDIVVADKSVPYIPSIWLLISRVDIPLAYIDVIWSFIPSEIVALLDKISGVNSPFLSLGISICTSPYSVLIFFLLYPFL